MDHNNEAKKKGIEAYLPYLIAGVLLVCVVIGGVLLFGGSQEPVTPTKPTEENLQTSTEGPSVTDPTEDVQIQPTEQANPGNTENNTDPQPTETPTTAPTVNPTEPTKTTEPPTEPDPHVHCVLMVVPEMWEDYMDYELTESSKGTKQVFYTEVQGKRVDLFAVTFGYVDKEKGFSMGTYVPPCGDKVPVAIESYQVTPESSWTDGDKNRINAMREEINSIIDQIRQVIDD